MRKRLSFIATWILFVSYASLYGQTYRKYNTHEFEEIVFQKSMDSLRIVEEQSKFRRYFIDDFVLNHEISIVSLPIVFNIVVAENKIPDKQIILGQIDALNRAFRNKIGMPEDDYYRDYAVDAEIEFCLPSYTDEFVRILPTEIRFRPDDFTSMKNTELGIDAFKPDQYINVWVVDIEDDINNEFYWLNGGFAQLPFRDSKTDGIVIDIDFFGANEKSDFYKEGYTLVHLLGIYLGLGPLEGFSYDASDFVDDTPLNNGPSIVCYEQTEVSYVATGTFGNERRMTRNFMDNIPDDCASMFTLGQKWRMHGILSKEGPRGSLLTLNENPCNNDGGVSTQDDDFKSRNIKIYPNPSSDRITLEVNSTDMIADQSISMTVINTLGAIIFQENINYQHEIDVQGWPSGIYILELKNANWTATKMVKVVK